MVVLGSQIASERKKKEDFQEERKSNQHKNKSKSQEVIDTSVANNNSLSINNDLDGLSSSTNWLGAGIYFAPPDDANCSDEDYAYDDNPYLHNLSGKQLMGNYELQVTGYDDNNDVRVIHDTDGLAEIDGDKPSCPNPITSINNWKEVFAKGEAQKELREKIQNFQPQENIILQELDAENSSWTYLRTFELFLMTS